VRHRDLGPPGEARDGEAELVTRVIAILDPLAPLCWRGLALWPDGMGTALAVAQGNSEVAARLEEIIIGEEAGNWATLRTDRCDSSVLRVEARQQRSWLQHRARDGGMQRLTYLMNPLLPCASPLLEGHWVLGLPDLLPALEAAAGRVDHRQTEPIDPQTAAAEEHETSAASRIDLHAALATLSPEHQDVLALREFEQLSYEEIADVLGVPRGTVESRLFRARAELREKLKAYRSM